MDVQSFHKPLQSFFEKKSKIKIFSATVLCHVFCYKRQNEANIHF